MAALRHGKAVYAMCAIEDGPGQRALYGPIGAPEFAGPVNRGILNADTRNKRVMSRLWDLPEKAVGFEWGL